MDILIGYNTIYNYINSMYHTEDTLFHVDPHVALETDPGIT